MKKVLAVMAILGFAAAFAVGTGYAGQALECVGIVKSLNKDSGVMVLNELDKDDSKTPTGKVITVTDDGAGKFKKNRYLMKNVKVHVTYEKTGKKNVVTKYLIIPFSC